MKISEDKQSHLSHLIANQAFQKNWVDCEERSTLVKITKSVWAEFCKADAEIDEQVRHKIASYKRGIMEGSPEWDIMYKKHYAEELNKKF